MKFVLSDEVTEPGIYVCQHPNGTITFENVSIEGNSVQNCMRAGNGNESEPLFHPCYKNCQWHGPLTGTDAYDFLQMKKHDD